jgi:hypothetical protein
VKSGSGLRFKDGGEVKRFLVKVSDHFYHVQRMVQSEVQVGANESVILMVGKRNISAAGSGIDVRRV